MGRRNKTKSPVVDTMPNTGIDASLYFNERDYPNWGKFVPFIINYGQSLSDAEVRVNQAVRQNLVDQSRHYEANLPEVRAAMQRLADFTIGTALQPKFDGLDQLWANHIKENYLNKVLSNLTRLGIASDWQSLWQLVLKIILRDGDVLMIPYTDRYGLPHLDFVEGHNILSRNTKVVGGRYDGYDTDDGVVYDSNRNILGYYIQGRTAEDDYTIAKSNCYLIYSPFSFSKGRGIPILASAARHGRNLMDYQHYIPQIIKVEGATQLVETNQDGKAPPGRTAYAAYNSTAPTFNSFGNTTSVNALTEFTQAGMRYLKANGGKLESLKSNRPTTEVQSYITATQKELLCSLFPYQLLLSPETVGGPGARGLKEVLVASINTHRAVIEKWAGVALSYVLSVGMSNPSLQKSFNFATNFKEDFTNWSFTKAPEPVLDPGYERAADLADLAAGITSPQAIVAKEGLSIDDINKQVDEAARKKAELVIQFQKDFPSLSGFAAELYGLKTPVVPNNPQQTKAV